MHISFAKVKRFRVTTLKSRNSESDKNSIRKKKEKTKDISINQGTRSSVKGWLIRVACEHSAGLGTADKRVLCAAIHQPSSISPPSARPKGLKLEQWISTYVAFSSRRRTRAALNAFSSTAKISQALRSSSRFPFLFFFSFFRTHTHTRARAHTHTHTHTSLLDNWPPPRTRAPFVRCEFALPSSRFAALPYLSHIRVHTRLLIPFPIFPLARAFTNFRAICRSVSFPSRCTGQPVFGARRYCASGSALLSFDFDWRCYPPLYEPRGTWSTWQIAQVKRYAVRVLRRNLTWQI